jgi:hypothetical protein
MSVITAATSSINSARTPVDDRLMSMLRNKFTQEEQHMFVQNFCMYLNYHPDKDYVIDLDDC